MVSKKVFLKTFGCQMNVSDSEAAATLLEKEGYTITDSEKADIILVNTCSVRGSAEQRAMSYLGRLDKRSALNGLVYGVLGCMAQARSRELIERFKNLGIVCGTNGLHMLPAMLCDALDKKRGVYTALDADHDYLTDTGRRKYSHKAFYPIMRGCDNYCSYCIVPYVRGREKSVPARIILENIQALAAQGVKEITLLGQNVNSYKDADKGTSFPALLKMIAKVEGIERIAFLTSHPKDLSPALIQALGEEPKLSRHLHLPVQSGSDRILDLMNRKYTRSGYLYLIDRIRQAVPDICLTTDAIVGFPSETDQDFLDTCSLFEEARFANAYIFKYSPREGTAAAKLKDDVLRTVKEKRNHQLLALMKKTAVSVHTESAGTTRNVLIDEQQDTDSPGYLGTTWQGQHIRVESSAVLKPGMVVPVVITEVSGMLLSGKVMPDLQVRPHPHRDPSPNDSAARSGGAPDK